MSLCTTSPGLSPSSLAHLKCAHRPALLLPPTRPPPGNLYSGDTGSRRGPFPLKNHPLQKPSSPRNLAAFQGWAQLEQTPSLCSNPKKSWIPWVSGAAPHFKPPSCHARSSPPPQKGRRQGVEVEVLLLRTAVGHRELHYPRPPFLPLLPKELSKKKKNGNCIFILFYIKCKLIILFNGVDIKSKKKRIYFQLLRHNFSPEKRGKSESRPQFWCSGQSNKTDFFSTTCKLQLFEGGPPKAGAFWEF